MSSKFTRIIYPAIALVIILVLLFVPVASFGDGLAPSGDYKVPFFDAVDFFFDNAGEVLQEPVAFFPVVVLMFFAIICIFHFIMGATGSRSAFLASSIICTVLWFAPIGLFLTKSSELQYLFDADNGAYAIGMYIILALFISSVIVAAITKRAPARNAIPPYGNPAYTPYGAPYQPQQPYQAPAQPYQAPAQPYQAPAQPYQPSYQAPEQPAEQQYVPEQPAPQNDAPSQTRGFCPSCGAPVEGNSPFCGNCGAKL